jgi:hypothetical protein
MACLTRAMTSLPSMRGLRRRNLMASGGAATQIDTARAEDTRMGTATPRRTIIRLQSKKDATPPILQVGLT